MDRVIKFRALYQGKMIENVPVDKNGKYSHCVSHGFALQYDPEYVELDVMQFTGLHDLNGKEIYEGDICKVTYYNHSTPDTVLIQLVVYENGSFNLKSNDAGIFELEDTRRYVPLYYSLPPNKIEVIGNIYMNPELLSNEKN